MTAEPTSIKYPKIKIKLTGFDGNAFSILGRVQEAARRAKMPESELRTFMDDATSGDYDHLLATTMRWFNVS